VDRYGVLFVRSEGEDPPAGSSGRSVAFPRALPRALADRLRGWLDEHRSGWREVPAESDKDAVRMLLDRPAEVAAAAGAHVFSGPHDFVGDGRKELEADRPGTLERVRVLHRTSTPEKERATVYFGCVFTRTDSGIRRLEQLSGRRYAFADETSTSGHIFPRMLLRRRGVELGRDFFAGGHPNAVQAVWDGKADGGSAFYSPPGEKQAADGSLVGDARAILMRRMESEAERRRFLAEVRILALTDPIPNDVCVVRNGFPEERWRRFEATLSRFIATEEGAAAYFDLVAGVAAAPTSDGAFDDFRRALETSGLSAEALLRAQEEKLRATREKGGDE
jgi:ABC-type phosphate/phosphonate transport system substrate-binding protein